MRVSGQLIYDSESIRDHVGTRTLFGVAEDDRTLCFRCRGLAVDLLVSQSGALQLIHGQVLDERSGAAVAEALARFGVDGERVAVDRFGQFALSGLVSGPAQFVWIDTPETQILCAIPGIE